MHCPGCSMLSATWTLPICCFAELSCEFLSEVLRLPMCTIAPDDLLGALEGVAFGCIVADADILKTLAVFRVGPRRSSAARAWRASSLVREASRSN